MKTELDMTHDGALDEDWPHAPGARGGRGGGSAAAPISLLSSSEPGSDFGASDSSDSSDSDSDSVSDSESEGDGDSDSVPETDSDSGSGEDMDLDSDADTDFKPEIRHATRERLPPVKLELSLPTDVPLPAPQRAAYPAPSETAPEQVKVEAEQPDQEHAQDEDEDEDEEDADRTCVDDSLFLDDPPAVSDEAPTTPAARPPAPAALPTAPNVPFTAPTIALNPAFFAPFPTTQGPMSTQPRPAAAAPRPAFEAREWTPKPIPEPTVRITQYNTYTPAVVEAVVVAAAPQAAIGTRLFYSVESYTPPAEGEEAVLSAIVIPPLEGGWCIALVEHGKAWGRLIAAPPLQLGADASASAPAGHSGNDGPGPLDARLARLFPHLPFHRIPLGGVPGLGERHAGLWAAALGLWAARWPWAPWRVHARGFQYVHVNMTKAREEHAALLAGRRLSVSAVECKVPAALQKKHTKGKKKKLVQAQTQQGGAAEKARREAMQAEGVSRAELKRQRREVNERNAAKNKEKRRKKKEKEEAERQGAEQRTPKERVEQKGKGEQEKEKRLKRKADKAERRARETAEERALNGTPGKKQKKNKAKQDTPARIKTEPGAENTPKPKDKGKQKAEVRVKTEPGVASPSVARPVVKQEPL